jgi:hypothetical protein
MKNLIRKILNEEVMSDTLTINGFKFAVTYLRLDGQNNRGLIRITPERSLTPEEFKETSEFIFDRGFKNWKYDWTTPNGPYIQGSPHNERVNGVSRPIEIISVESITVEAKDITNVIASYLKTSLDTQNMFNKLGDL